MSPPRSGYKELGCDLVEPLQDQPPKPQRLPMGDEKKDEGVGDPIKILLEEALEKQRNAMMHNFAQILQRLPTGGASTSNSHSGGATPFKVQVNFDIPIFEGQIDVDVIDIWLNLLEGYFLLHDFSDWEKIIFSLLKAVSPPTKFLASKLGARIVLEPPRNAFPQIGRASCRERVSSPV